jgi:hypothetical protein
MVIGHPVKWALPWTAIGDLHGCSSALAALVRTIHPTPLDTLELPKCPYHQPYRFTQGFTQDVTQKPASRNSLIWLVLKGG